MSFSQVAAQWNEIADERAGHLERGIDLSLERFIIPHVIQLMSGYDASKVLDAGCGLGHLTRELVRLGFDTVGVDLSARSIELAQELSTDDIDFRVTSVEDFASVEAGTFDIVVANMSLMTAPDLDGFLFGAQKLCRNAGSVLVVSIPHPAFWPRYWGYETHPSFRYDLELVVELPFKISKAGTNVNTTHVHRPIERYVGAIADAGFRVTRLSEPVPAEDLMNEYPEPWQFPRFLFLRAEVR